MYAAAIILVASVLSAHAGLSKLDALGMIESGNNDRAIGKVGEISRFQIRPHVWKKYSASKAYTDPRMAGLVADKHMAYLESYFRAKSGREPTDFDRYVMWNAGPSYYSRLHFSPRRVHPQVRDRAKRFANLRQMRNADHGAMLALSTPTGP